jgi:hypothetical protein
MKIHLAIQLVDTFIQPGLEPVNGPQAVIDLTDLGYILASMAEENPCHNTLSLSAASQQSLACGLLSASA